MFRCFAWLVGWLVVATVSFCAVCLTLAPIEKETYEFMLLVDDFRHGQQITEGVKFPCHLSVPLRHVSSLQIAVHSLTFSELLVIYSRLPLIRFFFTVRISHLPKNYACAVGWEECTIRHVIKCHPNQHRGFPESLSDD